MSWLYCLSLNEANGKCVDFKNCRLIHRFLSSTPSINRFMQLPSPMVQTQLELSVPIGKCSTKFWSSDSPHSLSVWSLFPIRPRNSFNRMAWNRILNLNRPVSIANNHILAISRQSLTNSSPWDSDQHIQYNFPIENCLHCSTTGLLQDDLPVGYPHAGYKPISRLNAYTVPVFHRDCGIPCFCASIGIGGVRSEWALVLMVCTHSHLMTQMFEFGLCHQIWIPWWRKWYLQIQTGSACLMIIHEWQALKFWAALNFPVMKNLAPVIVWEFDPNRSMPCYSITIPRSRFIQFHIPLYYTKAFQPLNSP